MACAYAPLGDRYTAATSQRSSGRAHLIFIADTSATRFKSERPRVVDAGQLFTKGRV